MEFIEPSIQSSGDYEGFKSNIKDLTKNIEEDFYTFIDKKYPDYESPISQEYSLYNYFNIIMETVEISSSLGIHS